MCVCVCVCVCVYPVHVEQWGPLMVLQVSPEAGLGGRGQTLEAALILCFHGNGVFLKGPHTPATGVEQLQVKGQRSPNQ